MHKNTNNLYDWAAYTQHLESEKNYRQQIKNLFGAKAMPSKLNKAQQRIADQTLGSNWQSDYKHHRHMRLEHKAQLTKPARMVLPPQKTTLHWANLWRTLKYSVLSFGLLWAKPTQAPEAIKANYATLTPTGALTLNVIMPGGHTQQQDIPLDDVSCNGLKFLQSQLAIGYKLDSTQLLITEGDTLAVSTYLAERLQHQQLMAKLEQPTKAMPQPHIAALPAMDTPDSTYMALQALQQNWRNMAKQPYGPSQKTDMLKWHAEIEKLPPKQRIAAQKKMTIEMARLEKAQAIYESKTYQKKLAQQKITLEQAINNWHNRQQTIATTTPAIIAPKDTATIAKADSSFATPPVIAASDSLLTTPTISNITKPHSLLPTVDLSIDIPKPSPQKPELGVLAFAGASTQGQPDILVQPRARFNVGKKWQWRLDGVLRHVPTFTPVADSVRQFTANLQAAKWQYTHLKQQGAHWLKTTLGLGPQVHFLSNPAPNMALLDNAAACTCTAGGQDLPHKNNQLTEYAEHYWGSAQINRRSPNSQWSTGLAVGNNTPLQWRNKNQPPAPNKKTTWLAHASYQHQFDAMGLQARVAANNNGWGYWAQAQDVIGRWGITFQQLNVKNLFDVAWARKNMASLMLSTQTKYFDASLAFQQQKLQLLNNQTQTDKTLRLTTGWPLDKDKKWTLTTENWLSQNTPHQHSIGLKANF